MAGVEKIMSRHKVSRRTILSGSALLLASTALPRIGWAGPARKGGRLVVAADSEPRNLNPALVASNGVFFVSSKIIEPLAEASYDGENGLAPRLAVSWEGAPNGLSAAFKLREGVKWHDGKPFTSADVAFSALSLWKPLQNLGRTVFKDLVAVDTPDELTAVFKFSRPTPFQLIRNALPALSSVVPKHLYENGGIEDNPANNAPVGTGPFKFAEYRPGEYYRLARNDSYWGEGEPYLDEIVYQVLPDRAAAASALEAGEIQLAAFSAVPLADLDRMAKIPGLKVVTKGYEGLTYQLVVEINHRRKELADLKVRQAIAHAIDRDFVVKTIFLGYAKASTGPVPRYDSQFYTGDVTLYPFDVAKANALLDEAGYRKGGDGVRFRLKLLPAPYFNETKQFGDYLRQALAAVGIDAVIVNHDDAAHQKAVYTDHDPRAGRHSRGGALLQSGRLRQQGARRADRQGRPYGGREGAYRALRQVPADGDGRPAADQRRRMGLHHGGEHAGEERFRQSALGGFQLGRYVDLIVSVCSKSRHAGLQMAFFCASGAHVH